MAVTKSQLAQWSREFEKKYPDRKSTESHKADAGAAKTVPNGTDSVQTKAVHVTKAQLAQWGQEFDAQQAEKQKQKENELRSKAFEDYRAKNNLGFADEMDRRSDVLNRQKVQVSPAGRVNLAEKQVQSHGLGQLASDPGTWYADQAQKLKNSYAEYNEPDAFDRANQWYDQPKNQELVSRLLEKKSGFTTYAEQGTSRNAASAGDGSIDPFRTAAGKSQSGSRYSTADLKKMGYTEEEIQQAREYLDTMAETPEWKQQTRRTANTVGGIADAVAAAPLMAGEYLAQGVKNIRQSSANRKALEAEVAQNPREKNLYDRLMETDMDYQPKYSTGDLLQQGFTRQEIEEMRSRIAGTEAADGIDPEKSVGYQLYDRGQKLTGAAQSGLSDVQRTVQGVVTSTAENLAVGAINPAAVLPVLSAQGAADAMGQSAAKGESAGRALAGGAAKFGAGWAINSVGAADLARTMGSDYAKDTLAGAVADKIRGLAGDSAFAKAHPAIANAMTGGMDNAMQAFVETYADKAIDAALGDAEAAQTMFTTDTLISALEAGLSGGASGALGGAVGTGLATLNAGDSSLRGNAERYAAEDKMEQAANEYQRQEALAQEPGAAEKRTAEESSGKGAPLSDSMAAQDNQQNAEVLAGNAENAEKTAENSRIGDKNAESAEGAANAEMSRMAVENAGESVETSRSDSSATEGREYAEFDPAELGMADEDSGQMRETYGLEAPRTESQKQARTEQVLRSWKVGEQAAQEISRKQPAGIDSDTYAAAASTLYRLGQMEDVKSFEQALELAGTGSGMAMNVNYVLGSAMGRNALQIAYTYGKDAAETRWAGSQLGGGLTEKSLTGQGESIYMGTLRSGNDVGSQIIELNAAATGTTAVMKNVLQNGAGQADSRVRAYVDTETARIFFGDSAQDVFGTVLHEDYHWYNALDSEGAKALQDHALLYLARSSGFETVDEMIRDKMADYAQQNLTYEEAAEELVGDAWRGIFSNESDFRRWVEFQRGQAEKNSGRAGTIRSVMNRVREMLGSILSRAKEVLVAEPDNKAALTAQRLAENERKILQDEYFAHAEKAMDNLRSAKENAAALKTESAAEGRSMRYAINPEYAKEIDDWAEKGRNENKTFILGRTGDTLQKLGAKENDIFMRSSKINIILKEHPEMTLEEIKRIPEVLDNPVMVLTSQNKGRTQSNTRLVMFGDVTAQDGRPVLCVLDLQPVENHLVINDMQKVTSAYTKDNNPVGFVRNSTVLYAAENQKRTTTLLRLLGFQLPIGLQRYGSIGSITYQNGSVKLEGVKFSDLEKSSAVALKTESAAEGRSIRFSIQKDADGESYIKIDEDILNGVPREEWKNVVKQAIKERYPNGFERNGWTILNMKEGRNEFVWSKSTKALQWENAEIYADKMRMAANLDEIIRTADEVYREPAIHKNAEAFNRGKIKVMVDSNVYEADVLTAIKTDQREIFYDIVNIRKTNNAPLRTHTESNDSRSSLQEGIIKPSGGTRAESKDSRSRLPEGFTEPSGKAHMESEDSGSRGSEDPNQSIAQENAESKRNSESVKKSVRFQLDSSFARNVDELDVNAKWSKRIRVGSTSEVLKSIGVKDQNIYWDSGKIRKILQKHSAGNFRAGVNDSIMTKEIIKQVPQVLENPIVVLHSDTSRNAEYASRIYLFGEVYDQTGKPVDVSLELLPTSNQGVELDNIMVTSAYGKKNVQGLLNRDQILYIDPNKNRTDTWLAVNRLQLPLRITRYGSIASLHYAEGDVKSVSVESDGDAKDVRFQLAEQADRDAKKNTQRQASRAIADNSAALETLGQMMGITRGVRISQDSIESLALRWTKTNGSRTDRAKIAGETRALAEYMKADGADMSKAQALAETISGEILDGATYRNTELWNQYPEYHDLSYTVNRDGAAKAELVKRYGSWSEAVAEARRHGVKLRQAEGVRDGNPAEQYEAIVNDTRSMGSVKDGAAALFRNAAKAAGVDGAASMESTEWLDVLMNVHDAIRPRMMSRFADAAEYEDAKVELADRMIGDILNTDEMNDAQAIFDSFQKWQRQTAAAAAGDEASAAQAVDALKGIQKEQTKEFNRRLRENQRKAAMQDYAEQNPDAGAYTLKTVGDMNERLTFLKESYERQLRAERERLKLERQQMLDEIALAHVQSDLLAHQVAQEQQRADYAERQLIVQDQEIADWEAENQKKKAEWEAKQRESDAKAEALWNEYTEKMQEAYADGAAQAARAKELAEKRAQRAREGRQKDELKRSIRASAAQLNQMILRPGKDRYVQQHLIQQAAEVAKLADQTLLNDRAVAKLNALRTSILQSMGAEGSPTGISEDWKQSKVPELIDALQADLTASKQAQLDRLHQQLTEAEALGSGEKAEMLRDRLKKRIRETENRTYLPMTVDQMRMLKAITASTLHVIRTANKTLSLQKAEAVDKIAQGAAGEITASKGNEGRLRNALTKYQLDMLGATRVFRMLGGYTKNSQMEKLANMLNDGQRRQTRITVEGTALFDNVTGKANQKQMERFAGPKAELVDIGLKDSKGRAAPLTHAQLCSLYMHLQNADSREHLLNGGLTIPDAEEYHKGNIEKAYQKGQTVRIGMLTDGNGTPMADTVIQAVENAMTDYDRAWCEDMKNFFGSYTTNLINETSMKLLGYQRAQVKNYYPIAVDKAALATQIEGLKLDATIEGRGFLKNRVKSAKPILLEECSSVVQRSLRDTAAYAGLAAPIRDVQKVLNSGIETEDGIKVLKNGVLKEQWGRSSVDYIDNLLTDLQSTQRKRSDSIGRALGKLRGNYAGAILTLNPGVAIAQAASLPTAGAVLGADTMAAVLPFVKNLSGKQRAALEAEIRAHGDVLLQYRLRGSRRGELASAGVNQSLTEKAMDALPKGLTGWINGMDEITVAALWEGAKRYVEHHPGEFTEGAAAKSSDAYWEAVNKTYQRVIEETQPNYTTMQRAGIQRSDNELTKTLTMFTTQRFQNYGILADAVGDYTAQLARCKADRSAENKAELARADRNLKRAAASQVTQTAVFALMKIGADLLLHRWDREQDENGNVTAASVWKRFASLFTESAAGNFLFGSELYSLAGNFADGTDYDVVSASNISAVNDMANAGTKLYTLIRKDTTGMDEAELEAYHQKLISAGIDVMDYGLELAGIPAANGKKIVDAFAGYAGDIRNAVNGEGFSFDSVPKSATGQYDRLYNAIQDGDAEEAAAALDKLDQMGKSDKVESELKKRLKKYDEDILTAAEARNDGKDKVRQEATKACIRKLYKGLDIQEGVKEDAAKREQVIDWVTSAVDSKADELLAGDKDRGVYDDLTDTLDGGTVGEIQSEIDRLLKAGKDAGAIKTKITGAVKSEYLAGSASDRKKLTDMLMRLKAGGEPLYEEKNFAQWEKDDEKKQEAAKTVVDEWKGVR